jgi:hypothetical protein
MNTDTSFQPFTFNLSNTTTVVIRARRREWLCRAQSRFLLQNIDQTKHSSGERTGKGRAIANKRRTSGTVNPASSSVPALFFLLLLPDAGEPGMGQHRQREIVVPTVPEAHFLLVQPCLALGLLNALLDRLAASSQLLSLFICIYN